MRVRLVDAARSCCSFCAALRAARSPNLRGSRIYRNSTRPRGLSMVAMMAGAGPFCTRRVEPECIEHLLRALGIRVFGAHRDERGASRRGGGRMRRRAPVDEVRHEAVSQDGGWIGVTPREHHAIGPSSASWNHGAKFHALVCGRGRECVELSALGDPCQRFAAPLVRRCRSDDGLRASAAQDPAR